jgi:hypothetical protein
MDRIDDFANDNAGGLIEGYRAMASDAAREREAEEWAEGMIGNSFLLEAQCALPASQCRPAAYNFSIRFL